ncbi:MULTISPECIES: helix-turn-helix domain-containing protein [unclassified Megasphaera]|uniref:helix-turn-helix domain-containing protein n=1 Tax=unclassified Megasphaera TaxID=2626256 RepID=UPI0025BC2C89|nr:helix-turn-helix domain-containing protein [Megasphaera sp. UBA4233]
MMLCVDDVIRRYFTTADGRPMFSRDMVYRMARRKEIPSMKVGRRVLFSDKALDKWVKEQNELPITE